MKELYLEWYRSLSPWKKAFFWVGAALLVNVLVNVPWLLRRGK